MLDKATGKMQAMDAEAGRIIRMEPRCPGVEYEDTGAGVRSEPLDAETRMKEYKRQAFHTPVALLPVSNRANMQPQGCEICVITYVGQCCDMCRVAAHLTSHSPWVCAVLLCKAVHDHVHTHVIDA